MRTLGTGLTSHIAGGSHTRAVMVRLDLVDGTTLAITDHDNDLSFDLGDGAVSYSASTGILPSDLALSTGFTADDIEVTGPITTSGLTTLTAVLGGRFDDAVARVFLVNWSDLTQGAAKLLNGYVALAEVDGDKFKLTIHSEVSKLSQTLGRVISAYCDADFGDTRCGISAETLAATVTAVTDKMTFAVSFTGTKASGYFNRGTVTFTGGALSGTRPVELLTFTGGAGTGSVALWAPLADLPAIGDTLTLKRGCSKLRKSDDTTLPTCLTYDNVVNFRGFPDVPGSDQVLKYPNPGG